MITDEHEQLTRMITDEHERIQEQVMTAKQKKKTDLPDDHALLALAHVARTKAYVPYSHFLVGAAVIDEQNRVFTGCNIENASYGATCCAERTAIFKAVSEGARAIRKLAVTGGGSGPCMPCGICRQVMAEFAEPDFYLVTDAETLTAPADTAILRLSMQELLPHAFKL